MECKVYINGLIGSFDDVKGVELIDIIQQVKAQQEQELTSLKVIINSPGGDVEKGFDFFNYFKSLKIPIHTVGVGQLCSIATVIFSAGDIRELNPNIKPMIHLPWGGIEGTAEEIKNYGDVVAQAEKRLIDHYKNELNLTEEAIRPLLKQETYLTDDQAIAIGFATKITPMVEPKAYLNSKTNDMSTVTKKDFDESVKKTEGMFEKIFNILKGNKVKALVLKEANGSDVDFTDLKEGDTPKVGDKATLDGSAVPDGDYVFPSLENITISFLNGEVSAVGTVDDGATEDVEALKAEIENLKAENQTLKESNLTQEKDLTDATSAINALKKEFDGIKKIAGSNFVFNSEKNGNQDDDAKNSNGVKRTPIKK